MLAINRKLFRDLAQMPGQILAISMVMACGVAVLIMAVGTHRFLKRTQDIYYEDYRFGHVFATLKRAPRPIGTRLQQIPGISALDLRIVDEAVMDVPGMDEPIMGRFISIPERGEPALNRIHIREGRHINPLQPGEVVASEAFTKANNLVPGDTVKAVINGRRQEFRIVGIALSPEYVFQIRPGTLLPDEKRFGVFWINQKELEAAMNMEGAFNSVSISLMHGASEGQVIAEVDRLLKPYGCTGAYGRDRQVSAKFLAQEIQQLRAMAFVAPSIFFGVACFLLNVVLERTIATQREQIAALKAFGYTNWEVGLHYAQFVLVIATFGCVIGSLGGEYLARHLSRIYSEFYRFPEFHYEPDWPLTIAGVGLTVLASMLATLRPVTKAVTLPPAEAMRPAPPANFRPTIAERLGIGGLFTASGRMVLRELERRPMKSFLSMLGIACAVSVLVLGRFGVDAIAYLLDFQFSLTQRYDLSVTFIEPTSPGVLRELETQPGVMAVETFRVVPVRFRAGHRIRLSAIQGLGDRRELFRIMNIQEKAVAIPPRGLVLGEKLAELLNVRAGDVVQVEILEREDMAVSIPVAGTFNELSGANAYIHRDHLHELLHETNACSGAFLQVDARQLPELYRRLKETPRVASVLVKKATVESFQKTVAENQLRMQSINMMFACIISFGVVFNTARISLAERSREFATLRVIGFTRWEVAKVLLGELATLTLCALPIGFLLGYGFCAVLVKAFESEEFRMPLIVSIKTMGMASGVTILAALASGFTVQQQINRLDLIGVLKNKE